MERGNQFRAAVVLGLLLTLGTKASPAETNRLQATQKRLYWAKTETSPKNIPAEQAQSPAIVDLTDLRGDLNDPRAGRYREINTLAVEPESSYLDYDPSQSQTEFPYDPTEGSAGTQDLKKLWLQGKYSLDQKRKKRLSQQRQLDFVGATRFVMECVGIDSKQASMISPTLVYWIGWFTCCFLGTFMSVKLLRRIRKKKKTAMATR